MLERVHAARLFAVELVNDASPWERCMLALASAAQGGDDCDQHPVCVIRRKVRSDEVLIREPRGRRDSAGQELDRWTTRPW